MITQTDHLTLAKFRRILNLLAHQCEPEMPLSYVQVLAEIMIAYASEGQDRLELSQRDLLERMYGSDDSKQSNVNRAVLALTLKGRHGKKPAYDMLELVPHPQDGRLKIIKLNARGKAVLQNIIVILRADKPVAMRAA
jgi:DNA-binding MarR family transcriptional regulator